MNNFRNNSSFFLLCCLNLKKGIGIQKFFSRNKIYVEVSTQTDDSNNSFDQNFMNSGNELLSQQKFTINQSTNTSDQDIQLSRVIESYNQLKSSSNLSLSCGDNLLHLRPICVLDKEDWWQYKPSTVVSCENRSNKTLKITRIIAL